jgi:hypothetical protein
MSDDTNKPADTVATTSAEPGPAPATPAAKPAASRAAVKRRAPRAVKPAAATRPVAAKSAGGGKKIAATRLAAAGKPAAAKPAPASPAPARKTAAKPAVANKPVAKPAVANKTAKPVKAKKVKLVRDSFTMPETEYALIARLKARCLEAGVSAKKSEILRAAVAGLGKLGDATLLAAIRKLDIIKTGRPAKQAK